MQQPRSDAELDSALAEFGRRAEAFCADVDRHAEMLESDFVLVMSIHLGHLYALAANIHRLHPDAPVPETTAGTRQLNLFATLEAYLQLTDRYRLAQFAYPDDDSGNITREGCLAGDLTDIYEYLYPVFQAGDRDRIVSIASHFASGITGGRTVGALQAIHEALYESSVFDDEP